VERSQEFNNKPSRSNVKLFDNHTESLFMQANSHANTNATNIQSKIEQKQTEPSQEGDDYFANIFRSLQRTKEDLQSLNIPTGVSDL